MPTIIVQSNASSEQQDSAASTILLEDVHPEHLASDHHADQLIERVGWAVTDAQNAEDIGCEGTDSGVSRSESRKRRAWRDKASGWIWRLVQRVRVAG